MAKSGNIQCHYDSSKGFKTTSYQFAHIRTCINFFDFVCFILGSLQSELKANHDLSIRHNAVNIQGKYHDINGYEKVYEKISNFAHVLYLLTKLCSIFNEVFL